MHQVFTFSLVAKQEVSNIDVKIATTAVTIFKTKCFFNIITLFYTCWDIFTTTFFSNRRKRIPRLVYYLFFLAMRELRIQLPKTHFYNVRVNTVTQF